MRDPEILERIRALAIPPAWQEVWICPQPNGHIQATGLDDAGRRQYRYHDHWQRRASALKFDQMLEFARLLPRLRRAVSRDIRAEGAGPERAAAGAVRMIDLTLMRIGGEQYADENGTFGAATLRRDHVSIPGGAGLLVRFTGKSGVEHDHLVDDDDLRQLAMDLRRRRSGPEDFFVYKRGRRWIDLTSNEVNAYIQTHTSVDCSAKDFRTWGATVLAAAVLAAARRREQAPETRGSSKACESSRSREKYIRRAIEQVAVNLGNTVSVCRSSYIDPRVLDRFRSGETIGPRGLPADGVVTRKQAVSREKAVRLLLLDS